MKHGSLLVLSVAFALVCSSAQAQEPAAAASEPTREQCIAASEQSQDLRKEGKLHDARAAALTCVSPSCPQMVRDDCTRRVLDLDATTPTMIFQVKSGAGVDLLDVNVSVDGVSIAARLDGKPLPLDPGPHKVIFEANGESVEKMFVVREGQQGRHESITIGAAPPSPPPPVHAPAENPTAVSPTETSGAGRTTIALVVAGAGVVGIGIGAAFGLSSSSKWDKAQEACRTSCGPGSDAQTKKSDAETAATISTIAFVGGAAALATGAVLWLTAPSASSPSTARTHVVPVGNGLVLRGSF